MLNLKYQNSNSNGLRQEEFLLFFPSQTYAKYAKEQDWINPYKPGVHFVGHRQKVQTQIRRRRTRRLIRIFTICLQNIQLEFE